MAWTDRRALNLMRVWEMSKSENFSDLDLPVSALCAIGAPAGGLFRWCEPLPMSCGNRISVRSSLEQGTFAVLGSSEFLHSHSDTDRAELAGVEARMHAVSRQILAHLAQSEFCQLPPLMRAEECEIPLGRPHLVRLFSQEVTICSRGYSAITSPLRSNVMRL
jgi:hypothetical protein